MVEGQRRVEVGQVDPRVGFGIEGAVGQTVETGPPESHMQPAQAARLLQAAAPPKCSWSERSVRWRFHGSDGKPEKSRTPAPMTGWAV